MIHHSSLPYPIVGSEVLAIFIVDRQARKGGLRSKKLYELYGAVEARLGTKHLIVFAQAKQWNEGGKSTYQSL